MLEIMLKMDGYSLQSLQATQEFYKAKKAHAISCGRPHMHHPISRCNLLYQKDSLASNRPVSHGLHLQLAICTGKDTLRFWRTLPCA